MDDGSFRLLNMGYKTKSWPALRLVSSWSEPRPSAGMLTSLRRPTRIHESERESKVGTSAATQSELAPAGFFLCVDGAGLNDLRLLGLGAGAARRDLALHADVRLEELHRLHVDEA